MSAAEKQSCVFVPDSHPVRLCRGTGVRDNEPINVSTTVGAVEARLLGEPLRLMLPMADLATPAGKEAKKNLGYIIGGPSDGVSHKGNGCREAENFPERDIVTLDVDTATPQYVDHLRSGTGALSDTRYGWHTTVSSTPEKPKLRIFLWPKQPLTAVDHRRCVDGVKLAIEAEHEGVWIDPTCGDAGHVMFVPAVCAGGVYDAGQNPGGFLDVDRFVGIAEAADEEAKRQAEEQRADAQNQREQARIGGYRDDAPEIQSRWREVLDGEGVRTEAARNPKAALASECPRCGPDVARVEWTAEGLYVCRVCGQGGNIFTFVKTREGIDGNAAFARCREPLGMPPRPRGAAFSQQADEEWSEPEPIPPPLLPVPAFDPEVLLPDVLRPWCMDEARRMRCAPEFIATTVVAELGSVIGARVALKPKSRDDGWLVVPNVWGGAVGRPSTMKTPSLTAALAPMGRLSATAQEAYDRELTVYAPKAKRFKAHEEAIESEMKLAAKAATKEAIEKPVTTANAGAEGRKSAHAKTLEALDKLGQEAPLPPILRRYRTNDATIEKIGEMLRDNRNGMLVYRDELCGLLDRWESKDGQEDRTFYLEAWNGKNSFDTDRIGRGHVYIPNHCLSVFGGIQPERLLACLRAQRGKNDGMFQRFPLLVYPDETTWGWANEEGDTVARDAAFNVFDVLADFVPTEWGATPPTAHVKFPTVTFNDEGQAVFVAWLTELRRERIPSENNPMLQEHLGKFDGLFCQLSMIFHFADRAAGGTRSQVGMESALRAAAWCEFLEAHARRCYGLLDHDGLEGAYQLATKIEDGTVRDGFTVRDIRRNRWKGLTTADDVDDAITVLVKRDWIRPRPTGGAGPGTGRATTGYAINPAKARVGGAS